MSRNWHDTFTAWSKPPSETEETKAANAARMINDALRASPALAKKNFAVTATGSYRNNTNTRTESDIDVAVVLKDACRSSYPADGSVTAAMLNFQNATYGLGHFRDYVGRALTEKFGTDGSRQATRRSTSMRTPIDSRPMSPSSSSTGATQEKRTRQVHGSTTRGLRLARARMRADASSTGTSSTTTKGLPRTTPPNAGSSEQCAS